MAGAGAGEGEGEEAPPAGGGDCGGCGCDSGSGCDRSDRTDQVGCESSEAMSVSWAGALDDQEECDLARWFCLWGAVLVFAA